MYKNARYFLFTLPGLYFRIQTFLDDEFVSKVDIIKLGITKAVPVYGYLVDAEVTTVRVCISKNSLNIYTSVMPPASRKTKVICEYNLPSN